MNLEFVKLSDPEWSRIADKVTKEYSNSCISYIKKVVGSLNNYEEHLRELEEQKELKKIEKQEQTQVMEKVKDQYNSLIIHEMFHGTKHKNIKNILSYGLKSEFNKKSAFGIGTYFSPYIEISLNYTDVSKNELSYVFVCDVIVNETKGNNYNIYVCPNDDSFCIKYLVAFHKDSE